MAEALNILAVGLLLGGIYSLVSVGLNLIFWVIRIVNFAQGEFVMLGMYGALPRSWRWGRTPIWRWRWSCPRCSRSALRSIGSSCARCRMSR